MELLELLELLELALEFGDSSGTGGLTLRLARLGQHRRLFTGSVARSASAGSTLAPRKLELFAPLGEPVRFSLGALGLPPPLGRLRLRGPRALLQELRRATVWTARR